VLILPIRSIHKGDARTDHGIRMLTLGILASLALLLAFFGSSSLDDESDR
jgi:hypothetical protein